MANSVDADKMPRSYWSGAKILRKIEEVVVLQSESVVQLGREAKLSLKLW